VNLLKAAVPLWRETHAQLDAALGHEVPARLRANLRRVPPATVTLSPGGRITSRA
jgi:hypothetical protein